MKKIVDKIFELGFKEYAVCFYEGKTWLLVFMAYNYYEEEDERNFPASPYYFASNKAYFASKQLVEYIGSLGYTAEMRNKIIYDSLLEKSGALRGDNNLFFINGCGSLFCVHAIETDVPMEEKSVHGKECKHCGMCKKCCPMNALNHGVDAEQCLRKRMDIIDDIVCRDAISNLLGCDMCQKVCPNNKYYVEKKTYKEFNKKKILSGDMSGLSELIGKNMSRKTRLQFQAMCIIANSRDRVYFNNIDKIESELLPKCKKWCLETLKNIDL